MNKKSVIVAFTGASGSAYGLRLLECLVKADCKICVIISKAAQMVLATETSLNLPSSSSKIAAYFTQALSAQSNQIRVDDMNAWTSPVASGTHHYDAMVICPCSAGTLGAIANGMGDNLIERAADVMLKERRKLILVPRETPYNMIHLENMLKLTQMGAVILPASPGFYFQPKTIEDLIDFVVGRILQQLDIPHSLTPTWGIDKTD